MTAQAPEDEETMPRCWGLIALEWIAHASADLYAPLPYAVKPWEEPCAMPWAALSVLDVVTGKPIAACLGIVVRAGAAAPGGVHGGVTAELTLWADADGGPVLDHELLPQGPELEDVPTGAFLFGIAGMRVRQAWPGMGVSQP